jgi:hypothetical protein
MPTETTCSRSVYWWDGEYEGECVLPEGHGVVHYDGLSFYDDDGAEVERHDPPKIRVPVAFRVVTAEGMTYQEGMVLQGTTLVFDLPDGNKAELSVGGE